MGAQGVFAMKFMSKLGKQVWGQGVEKLKTSLVRVRKLRYWVGKDIVDQVEMGQKGLCICREYISLLISVGGRKWRCSCGLIHTQILVYNYS